MSAIASQITSLTIVYSTVYSGADQGKHESSASLAFVRGIHRERVNSRHKCPVTLKMFPFDDVILVDYMDLSVWERLLNLITQSFIFNHTPQEQTAMKFGAKYATFISGIVFSIITSNL